MQAAKVNRYWTADDIKQLRSLYGQGKSIDDVAVALGRTHQSVASKAVDHHDLERIHVDHDHATGQIRGLLCFGCNSILGLVKDSPDILQRAIGYLRRAKLKLEEAI